MAKGFVTTVQLLLQHNVDLTRLYPNNESLLHAACQYGQPRVLSILLKLGVFEHDKMCDFAELEKGFHHGVTPAFVAAQNGSLSCLQVLVQHGADLNLSSEPSCAPLHMAIQQSNYDIVKFMLKFFK